MEMEGAATVDVRNETTAAKIRALALEGAETAEIARQLGIRYQHAYNVLKASPPFNGL